MALDSGKRTDRDNAEKKLMGYASIWWQKNIWKES
jgi:hypothetical protein